VEGQAKAVEPDCTRRFIRGASRGCKVRNYRGFIIDPTDGAEAEQSGKAAAERPEDRTAGQLADQSTGSADGPEIWGDLEISKPVSAARGVKSRGNP